MIDTHPAARATDAGSVDLPPPECPLPAPLQYAMGYFAEARGNAWMRRRAGDVFTLDLPQFDRLVVLCDPAEIRRLWAVDPADAHAGESAAILEPIIGTRSVLLLDEDEHVATRKLLLPPFHGERMRSLVDAMREETAREMASWPTGRTFALLPRMQRLTMRVILRTVFGIEQPAGSPMERALERMLRRGMPLLVAPAAVQRLGQTSFDAARRDVDRLLDAEIARGGTPGSVLAELLAAGQPHAWVRDQLLTLLVAGHETTATALAWTVERLVRTPPAMAHAIAAARGDADRRELDWVVTETLRIRPPLTYALRRATVPLAVAGHRVEPGWTIAAALDVVHHDPALWNDPHRFDPQRFAHGTNGLPWLPFGGGRRRCLGAAFAQTEMREVLATLLKARNLRAPDPRPERRRRRGIVLVPHARCRVVASPAPTATQ